MIMNIYLTEMEIVNSDYANGLAKVAGPRIEASSEKEAFNILRSSGLTPHARIIGRLESEK